MKRWSIGLAAAYGLMGALAGAEPASTSKESLEGLPQKGSRFELKANPQSEQLNASLHAAIEEDGARIETRGIFRVGDSPLYYHIEIDLKTRTYKATKKEVPSEWLKGQPGRKVSDYTPNAISPGYWYAEGKIITEDPPQIDLATTLNYVLWYVYTDGSIGINNVAGNCTPYNGTGQPYPVDTHWYVNSCTASYYNPWAQQINGSYYNWDWGWDDKATTTAHSLGIQPNNDGSFYYWDSYSHAGEDSYLLQVDLFLNGYQVY